MKATFSVGQGINISFVYTLDAYENLRGEVTITQLAFKCKYLLHLTFGTPLIFEQL